jgi:hypothetical protein
MIYLEETLNITPARPDVRDEFIKITQDLMIPACKRLGVRLVTAWYGNYEWVMQTTHMFEFENMEALKSFRINSCQDKEWGEYLAELDVFSPVRRSRLIEPIGALPLERFNKAIEESQKTPLKVYTLAVLEVNPDKMTDFIAMLKALPDPVPIIACWRPISGNPNQVIDLWKGDIWWKAENMAYQPATGDQEWVRQLREIAPKERILPIYTLPYSPLL